MPPRILIIAGEASGDLHGGALVRALRDLRPDLELFGVGGDCMSKAGMELLYHVRTLSMVGFSEVIRHLPRFIRLYRDLDRTLRDRSPDVVVLIDYPGFNLRFARRARRRGIATFYYIAPQVWAWGTGRAKKMAKFINNMAVIFDFEVPFFQAHGLSATFVGHPLLDIAVSGESRESYCRRLGFKPEHPILALFPGSRIQELNLLLPPLLQTAAILRARHPDLQITLSLAPTLSPVQIQTEIKDHPWVKVVRDESFVQMRHAAAALAASGTVTLELALSGTPFAIIYRVSTISYFLGKKLVTIPRIGLVNVVAGKEVVREFIQDQVQVPALCAETEKLLFDPALRQRQQRSFEKIRVMLGEPGAAARTARLLLETLAV